MLRDFHKSEKVTILGKKKEKKVPGVEGPKNDHFGREKSNWSGRSKNDYFGRKKKEKNPRLRDFHNSEKVNNLGENRKKGHFGEEKKSTWSGRSK